MTGTICTQFFGPAVALVECERCAAPVYGDDDNLPALRAQLSHEGWEIEREDVCPRCVNDDRLEAMVGRAEWLRLNAMEATPWERRPVDDVEDQWWP